MSLKAIWSENTPYSKFLLTVGLILISVTFFTLVSLVIAGLIYGLSVTELNALLTDYSDPRAIQVLKFIQTFSTIGSFIFPAFCIAYLFSPQPIAYLSLNKKATGGSILLVVLALLVALPLINFTGELNSRMSLPSFLSSVENWMRESEDKATELFKYFLDMHSTGDVLFNLFMMALLPAIGEELIFRGIIQRIFSAWLKNIHVAVWLSAILFSAFHFQFYGFLPRMMLGVMFGYLLVWSGSLWLPMVAHFVNNAAIVIMTYLFREDLIGVDADTIGTQSDYVSVLVSLACTGVLLWMVYKREKPQAEPVVG
jgi:membrane protease YdiL (CAAX protease family)